MNWHTTAQQLADQGLTVITDRQQCHKRSQDYSHFSPILTEQLKEYCADFVVLPTDESQIKTVVQHCVQQQISITVRAYPCNFETALLERMATSSG